jgi:hypothetical protein
MLRFCGVYLLPGRIRPDLQDNPARHGGNECALEIRQRQCCVKGSGLHGKPPSWCPNASLSACNEIVTVLFPARL